MLAQERLHGGSSLATYLVGLRGPECRRDDTTGVMRWYLYDGLGSVLGEVAPTGAVVSSRSLDVYGKQRGSGTGTATSKQAFVGSLGHTTDAETGGLVYMRARYMDTNTGRFVSEDPGRSGGNWFAYSNDNPVENLDVDGRFTMIGGEIVGLISAISACLWCAEASAPFRAMFAAWGIGFGVNIVGMAMYSAGIKNDLAGGGASIMTIAATGGLLIAMSEGGGVTKKGDGPASSIGAFWSGYGSMLVATAFLLDIEVNISTGGNLF